jgi:mannosyltransferase
MRVSERANENRFWRAASRAELIILLLVLLLGGGLRGYRLGAPSLWFDEAASVEHSRGSISDTLTAVSEAEGSPPLYFLLLREVMQISRSEAALRALSLVAGVASLLLIYLLGRALLGAGTGLIAAALLALSPFALYYSQEARPYALLTALSLASCYLLLLALERPGKSRWARYALVSLAALYTHYFTVFLLLAQGIVILTSADYRKKFFFPWLCCQGLMLLAFLPWLPYLITQFHWQAARGGQTWVPNVGLLMLPYTFFQFSLGYSTVEIKSFADILSHPLLLGMALLGFGLPALVSLRLIKTDPRAARWSWLIPAVAVGVAFGLHLKWHFYQPVYLAGVMPLYLLVIASGLKSLSLRPGRLLPALLIFPLLGIALQNYYFNPAFAKEDWRGIGRYLEKNLQSPGTLVFHKSWLKAPVNYYYPAKLISYSLPDAALPADSPQLQEIKQRLSPYPRVWLVLGHNYDTGDYYRKLLARWFKAGPARAFTTDRTIWVVEYFPGSPPSAGK